MDLLPKWLDLLPYPQEFGYVFFSLLYAWCIPLSPILGFSLLQFNATAWFRGLILAFVPGLFFAFY